MAATRLISIHSGKEKSVSSYACDPHTVDAELLLSKQQDELVTGRTQKNDVTAYQFRQFFRPGEITPEGTNQVGCEFADRFLNG